MDWVMPWRRQISATDSWPLSPSRTTSSFALAVQRRRFSEGCCFSLISSHSRDGVFDERAHSPLRHCQPSVGVSIFRLKESLKDKPPVVLTNDINERMKILKRE